MEVAKHVIAKCGGLPQVIASVGEWFAGGEYPVCYLYDFMGSLEGIPEFHGLRSLLNWMQSYFDACSDSLKPCIFYLSVFPIGHNIRQMRLLSRWVAEGYSKEKNNEEKLFLELVSLSIIQQSRSCSNSSKIDVCQVNGFFHEYIMSRPMQDNLVFALEGPDSTNSRHAGAQHLTVRSSWPRDENGFQSLDLSRLRSLTVFGEWKSFFISANMRLLRVLDLEDTSGLSDDELKHIGRLLPRLKFLSLRGCKDITHLPDSLCCLRQLQTLDVRHTKIIMLPCALFKLRKLQYIRAGTTYEAPEVQDGESYIAVPPLIVASESGDSIDESSDEGEGDSSVADLQIVPKVESHGATPVVAQVDEVRWRSRWAHELVVSCSSLSKKFSSRCCRRDVYNGGGVKVPGASIGNLTALHTLGVVNATTSGKVLLKEITKLTQLRKLGVSGINKGNIEELFRAIPHHSHLESLSVRVDKDDFACLDDTISLQPPKTLGPVCLGCGWLAVQRKLLCR
jgi:Leucine-rich repeat (LRR) protein